MSEIVSPVGAKVSRSASGIRPANYIFKIESFSLLLDTNIENYESDDFEAGGYKWRLSLYPNGNKRRNERDHISLYLVISDTDNLPYDWEVNVSCKLFVFDHINDKYLVLEDVERVTRFHRSKTEWGFDQFLSLDTLKNASNGYVLDDCCVFGAEVYVIKYEGKGECLSMKKELDDNTYTWKVDNFSAISKKNLYSEVFNIGGRKWKILLYPKGINGSANGRSMISLYLAVADSETLNVRSKLYAKFKLRIRDQVMGKHIEKEESCWFCASIKDWGFTRFMLLSDLLDETKGFLLHDAIIVETEIIIMSAIRKLSY